VPEEVKGDHAAEKQRIGKLKCRTNAMWKTEIFSPSGRGDGTPGFSDCCSVSAAFRLHAARLVMLALNSLVDFLAVDGDLAGRLDLFAANGHLEDEINRVQSSQTYEQPSQLFWNAGPEQATEFLLVSREKCGDDLLKPTGGRGASYADIDGDGDLDILVTAIARPARLLRNDQDLGHEGLRLRLEGTQCNRDAIGAWVEVHTPDRVLRQQVMPTRSYLSQAELPLTFGLGRGARVERVVIHWPDGSVQELPGAEPGRTIHVRQQIPAIANLPSPTGRGAGID